MSGAVAAVVLAAGAAARFGAPKQRLLLPRVLERLAPLTGDGSLAEVVVVEGAYDLDDPAAILPGSRLVGCEGWERGPGVSLRCGLAALGAGVEAAVVVLADGPDLSAEAVRRVVAAWRAGGGGDIVAASYGGVRGHPLLVARAGWAHVPDEGLRMLEPALIPCDDLGAPGDVDTPEDLV